MVLEVGMGYGGKRAVGRKGGLEKWTDGKLG